MSGRIGNCTFSTEENQQINACVRIQRENRSALIGVVVDECGTPVEDAVVALYKLTGSCGAPQAISHTFTDRFGQFCFGPLCPDNTYMLKITKDSVEIKEVTLNCSCNPGGCLGEEDDDCSSSSSSSCCEKNRKQSGCRGRRMR